MAKLMPGRVRNEGIELFEKDLITIHQVSETQLDTTVDQHHLIYALNDSEITCDCVISLKKAIVPIWQRIEYYLKMIKKASVSWQNWKRNKNPLKAKSEVTLLWFILEWLSLNGT